jgi:hypothetical protein
MISEYQNVGYCKFQTQVIRGYTNLGDGDGCIGSATDEAWPAYMFVSGAGNMSACEAACTANAWCSAYLLVFSPMSRTGAGLCKAYVSTTQTDYPVQTGFRKGSTLAFLSQVAEITGSITRNKQWVVSQCYKKDLWFKAEENVDCSDAIESLMVHDNTLDACKQSCDTVPSCTAFVWSETSNPSCMVSNTVLQCTPGGAYDRYKPKSKANIEPVPTPQPSSFDDVQQGPTSVPTDNCASKLFLRYAETSFMVKTKDKAKKLIAEVKKAFKAIKESYRAAKFNLRQLGREAKE